MKKVLVTTFNTPGYAPNELIEYLENKRSDDIEVSTVQVPAKHDRLYIPGWTHYLNIRQVIKETRAAKEHYDIAVGPDPAFVAALHSLKSRGLVGKIVYWRLDYYPYYRFPLNTAYQKVEQRALQLADEIWSISDPRLPHIEENLQGYLHKTKFVPYLLHERQVQDKVDPSTRDNIAMWMGPDLDGSRPLCEEAASALKVPFFIADYSIEKYRRSQEELHNLLRRVKVGIALYKPEPGSSKYFADVSRIRRFLTYGVPVITTRVAPTHSTIKEEHCGFLSDWSSVEVSTGIRYCLNNFNTLSENAYRAAEKFTFESWFAKNSELL